MPCEPTVEPATVKSATVKSATVKSATVKSAAMESTAAAVKSAATTSVSSFGQVRLEKRGSEQQSGCGYPQNLSYPGPSPIFV